MSEKERKVTKPNQSDLQTDDFVPSDIQFGKGYQPLGEFKYWVQKVLPTVYDDSLSYSELLYKVVAYLNVMNENNDLIGEDMKTFIAEFNRMVDHVNTLTDEQTDYINDYFNDLDVTEEINQKLNQMANDGTFNKLWDSKIQQWAGSYVTNWISANISGSSDVVIDNSLSIDGAVAGAKAVGNEFMKTMRAVGPFNAISLSEPQNEYLMDLNTVPCNSIITYSVIVNSKGENVKNLPINYQGTLLSFIGFKDNRSSIGGEVQVYFSTNNEMFYRLCWTSNNTWSRWKKIATSNLLDLCVSSLDNILRAEDLTDNSPYLDFNEIPKNKVVTYNQITSDDKTVKNMPTQELGTLLSFSGKGTGVEKGGITQIFSSLGKELYYRMCWGSTNNWGYWKKIITGPEYESSFISPLKIALNGSMLADENYSLFTDLNNLKANTVVTYGNITSTEGVTVNNLPVEVMGTVLTFGPSNEKRAKQGGLVQLYCTTDNRVFYRIAWGSQVNYLPWIEITHKQEPKNYASISLFEKIGVIGDSYSVGQIYWNNGNSNTIKKNLSWGKILERKNGINVNLYGGAGLSTKTWLANTGLVNVFKNAEADNLYILCLGINDVGKEGMSYLGSIDDINVGNPDSNPNTFYGNYGRIIEMCKNKNAGSKIVISTTPFSSGNYIAFNNAIIEIANKYGIALIRQDTNTYLLSSLFNSNKVGGHPIGVTYSGMADAIQEMIEKEMNDNINYFKDYRGLL